MYFAFIDLASSRAYKAVTTYYCLHLNLVYFISNSPKFAQAFFSSFSFFFNRLALECINHSTHLFFSSRFTLFHSQFTRFCTIFHSSCFYCFIYLACTWVCKPFNTFNFTGLCVLYFVLIHQALHYFFLIFILFSSSCWQSRKPFNTFIFFSSFTLFNLPFSRLCTPVLFVFLVSFVFLSLIISVWSKKKIIRIEVICRVSINGGVSWKLSSPCLFIYVTRFDFYRIFIIFR